LLQLCTTYGGREMLFCMATLLERGSYSEPSQKASWF